MPAFCTHYILASEEMSNLHRIAAESGFKLCENAVYIGSQGPDIFFFHRTFPWQKGKPLRAAGSAMHRAKFGDILDRFADYIKASTEPDIARSYAYGFILHYAADRNCHPYIYYLQNRLTDKHPKLNPNSAHNMIEFALDSVLLQRKAGIESPRGFDASQTFNFTQTEKHEIGKMLEAASAAFAPPQITARDAEFAIEDTKNAERLLTDANGKKAAFFSKAEKLAAPFTNNFKISSFIRNDDLENDFKCVNINNRPWKSPFSGKESRQNFFDLYELSKKDALDMIKKFELGLCGKDITGNLSFLTGTEVK